MPVFNIPVYGSNAAGYPDPPPQAIAAIFADQGFGQVMSVDIAPFGDGTTPSAVWAVSPSGPCRYIAFVHCLDNENGTLSQGEMWLNSNPNGTHRLHWDESRPLTEDDSPYWIIRRSNSVSPRTACVATYKYDPWSLQPIVILRDEFHGSINEVPCALRGHGTAPGWGVCPPGTDKNLRYDLRNPPPQTFGHRMASPTGDICFTLAEFIDYYGPVGAALHAAAPVATAPTNPTLDLGVTLDGRLDSLDAESVTSFSLATREACETLQTEGAVGITGTRTSLEISIAIQPCSVWIPSSNDSTRRQRIARIQHCIWTITQALDKFIVQGAIRPSWRLFVPSSRLVGLPSTS